MQDRRDLDACMENIDRFFRMSPAHPQYRALSDEISRDYRALGPEQRTTLRASCAATTRRWAEQRGQQRVLRILDAGFVPAGVGTVIAVDSGRFASIEEARSLVGEPEGERR
jgi:hypothetical protein